MLKTDAKKPGKFTENNNIYRLVSKTETMYVK